MSWLSKAVDSVSDAVKRTVSNPAKLVSDISTFGTTAILRTLPKSIGGGQSGVFSKGSEVFGGTAIGVGVGFVTGGPAGAVVGGASGFGGGISGVVHGSSGTSIATTSAKYAAITGSVAGAAKGVILARGGQAATAFTGPNAAGIVGKGSNLIYGNIASKALVNPAAAPADGFIGPVAPAASGTSWFGSLGKGLETLAPLALLNVLQGNKNLPGTSGGTTGVTLNSVGPGTPTTGPAQSPTQYPGVPAGIQTVGPGGAGVAVAPAATNWLLYGALAAGAAFLYLKKKKRG